METIKKFKRYLIIFLVGFIIVELFTSMLMKEKFEDIINHDIVVISPKITIKESKASYSRGYIKGSAKNNTGEHLRDKYLQFDFYNKDGIYVGTESKEIKYFNVSEEISFEINYNYRNIDKIKISFVDEVIKPKSDVPSIFNKF